MSTIRREILRLRITILRAAMMEDLQRQRNAENKRRRKRKKIWTKMWIQRRNNLGLSNLMRELADEEPEDFKNIVRMTDVQFHELLQLVAPLIQRNDTKMREALPAKLKLEITLRFLAGGESFRFLSRCFRVGVPSISLFLPEVLTSITQVLASYIQVSYKNNLFLYVYILIIISLFKYYYRIVLG